MIRRIKPEELNELVALATKDNHQVLAPTHVVVKKGSNPRTAGVPPATAEQPQSAIYNQQSERIVGYFSIDAIPLVSMWLDSEAVTARDSLHIQETLESILDHSGVQHYLMPCESGSPFYPKMQKLGYINLGQTDLHVKQVGLRPRTAGVSPATAEQPTANSKQPTAIQKQEKNHELHW